MEDFSSVLYLNNPSLMTMKFTRSIEVYVVIFFLNKQK